MPLGCSFPAQHTARIGFAFFFTSLYRFLPPVMISRRRGDGFKEVIVRSISVLVSETTVSHAGGSTLPPNKEVQPRPCSEMGEETATLF